MRGGGRRGRGLDLDIEELGCQEEPDGGAHCPEGRAVSGREQVGNQVPDHLGVCQLPTQGARDGGVREAGRDQLSGGENHLGWRGGGVAEETRRTGGS